MPLAVKIMKIKHEKLMGGLMTPVRELTSQSIKFYFAISFISSDLFPFHNVKVKKATKLFFCFLFFVNQIFSLIES